MKRSTSNKSATEDIFIGIYNYSTHKIQTIIFIPGTYDTNLHVFLVKWVSQNRPSPGKQNKYKYVKMNIPKIPLPLKLIR